MSLRTKKMKNVQRSLVRVRTQRRNGRPCEKFTAVLHRTILAKIVKKIIQASLMRLRKILPDRRVTIEERRNELPCYTFNDLTNYRPEVPS